VKQGIRGINGGKNRPAILAQEQSKLVGFGDHRRGFAQPGPPPFLDHNLTRLAEHLVHHPLQ
jgi:hypothetical protein